MYSANVDHPELLQIYDPLLDDVESFITKTISPISTLFKLLRSVTVWTVVTVCIAKYGIWLLINVPLLSNDDIPFACPISLLIKSIPDVNVDRSV